MASAATCRGCGGPTKDALVYCDECYRKGGRTTSAAYCDDCGGYLPTDRPPTWPHACFCDKDCAGRPGQDGALVEDAGIDQPTGAASVAPVGASTAAQPRREPRMIVSQHYDVRQPWWTPWSHLTVWMIGFRLRLGWLNFELDVSRPPARWRSWKPEQVFEAEVSMHEEA